MENIVALEKEISKIEDRIKILKDYPSTRKSEMGMMIQPVHVIREWEELDDKVGKMRAELHSLKNPGAIEETELIYYEQNCVIETTIKNGIVVKGGLLDSYFNGRLASEHQAYVTGRHGKTCDKVDILQYTIVPKDDNVKNGIIVMKCSINNDIYSGVTGYKVKKIADGYIFFNTEKKAFTKESNPSRGLSKKEKGLMKYICAKAFRSRYCPNDKINLTNC